MFQQLEMDQKAAKWVRLTSHKNIKLYSAQKLLEVIQSFIHIFSPLLISSVANALISITAINRTRWAGFVLNILVNGTLLSIHALKKYRSNVSELVVNSAMQIARVWLLRKDRALLRLRARSS